MLSLYWTNNIDHMWNWYEDYFSSYNNIVNIIFGRKPLTYMHCLIFCMLVFGLNVFEFLHCRYVWLVYILVNITAIMIVHSYPLVSMIQCLLF